jgi:hypothetical protein
MESQTKPKMSAKDFFINLGAIVALYTTVVSLLNLLFRVINVAFPQTLNNYYAGSQSVSFPVATLIIFFPIFILLMWFLERSYKTEPDKKQLGVRRWLTYITLFVAGLTLAGDLVTVLYYFLDGRELTAGFMLKVLSVFVVILMVFLYYISDIRNKLTTKHRKMWLGVSLVLVLGSIIWGFVVLGSPRTQQLIKYDDQKVSDLQNINSQIQNYYQIKNVLPTSLSDLAGSNTYYTAPLDMQSKQPYEYTKTGNLTYEICATFNKESTPNKGGYLAQPTYGGDGFTYWNHPASRYCFAQIINPNIYQKGVPIPAVIPVAN